MQQRSAWLAALSFLAALSWTSASANQSRPWTVQDSIAVTYYERSSYGWSSIDADSPVHFSPDEQYFFFVKRRGELACDCNVFTLEVFSTAAIKKLSGDQAYLEPYRRFELRSRASEVGYAGISSARWDERSQGIYFLHAADDLPPQVARLNLVDGRVELLTNVPLGVTQFDTANGTLLFRALLEKRPRTKFKRYPVTRVEKNDLAEILGFPYDYIFGSLVSYRGAPATALGSADGTDEFWLAPDGRRAIALRRIEALNMPDRWRGYKTGAPTTARGVYERSGGESEISAQRFTLIDLAAATEKPVFDAPIGEYLGYRFDGTRVLWSPDGSRVILANTLLPLSKQSARQDFAPYIVDYSISDGTWRLVTRLPADATLYSLSWAIPGQSLLATFSAANGSHNEVTRQILLSRNRDRWSAKPAPERVELAQAVTPSTEKLHVDVHESANDPPEVIARYGGSRIRLSAPDPALDSIWRAPVESLTWTDKKGRSWTGGLMLPQNARDRQSMPLVILAYAFEPERFLPDGISTTAFAAQPLVARGMAVLQLRRNSPDWSPTQGADFVEGVDGAVDALALRFSIDRARVGLVGFSQTGSLITYAVTHPARTRFAAAIDADGGDPSYNLYLMDALIAPTTIGRFVESFNGEAGKTFWQNKLNWLEQAPGFNLDRVETPLMLTVNGRHNAFIGLNELYVGLKKLGKPVEYLFFPDGSHELRRPQERQASMAATVDWMAFWLLGEEDSDPLKMDQYESWRRMRGAHSLTTSQAQGPESPASLH